MTSNSILALGKVQLTLYENLWTSPFSGSAGSLESIKLREELIQWSVSGKVWWKSEGQMVHYRRVAGVQDNGLVHCEA